MAVKMARLALSLSMRSTWALLVLLLALTSPPDLRAEETPIAFLENLQAVSKAELADTSRSETEREMRFRELFREKFDLPTIGKFVIGRFWKKADATEKESFLRVFEDAMVQRFLPIFSESGDLSLNFVSSAEDKKRKGVYLVNSILPLDNGERVKVVWRINIKNDQAKILDIVVEGASMAITLRSEYGSFLKGAGGQLAKLNNSLREKVDNGAFRAKIN